MVLRTCEAEINGKIQNKFCLCVIGLCSLGFIQICFPPAAEKLNISEHRCVSFVRQCWSTPNKETFPLFLKSVSRLTEKHLSFLMLCVSSDNRMKALTAQRWKGRPDFPGHVQMC